MKHRYKCAVALAAVLLAAAGCSRESGEQAGSPTPAAATAAPSVSPTASPTPKTSLAPSPSAAAPTPQATAKNAATAKPGASGKEDIQVVAEPESISVLVNKQFALPDNYAPADLVYPDVAFVFKEKIEKRKMRQEAASALEKLFAAAEQDGVQLAGVSAYRSHETQKALFQRYVQKDGEAKARTYSAVPGTSEHETGLAIDVSGRDGKCAAQDCFGGTKEAEWLEAHAAEHGFIIRYPQGKQAITGYQYEPWHIRYVGTEIAEEMAGKGLTLEEFLNAVPVSK